MFQFRAFPALPYFIQIRSIRYCRIGFPHSEISGSMRMCRSPKLIAACHVLHRLLMPRHSPCALISLTYVVRTIFAFLCCCKHQQYIRFVCSSSSKQIYGSVWSVYRRSSINSGSLNYAGFRRILTLVSIVVLPYNFHNL